MGPSNTTVSTSLSFPPDSIMTWLNTKLTTVNKNYYIYFLIILIPIGLVIIILLRNHCRKIDQDLTMIDEPRIEQQQHNDKQQDEENILCSDDTSMEIDSVICDVSTTSSESLIITYKYRNATD